MKRTFIVLAMLLAAALMLTACGGTEPYECTDALGCVDYAEDEPVRIASALVISGPNTDLGIDSQYGVEIAMDWQGQLFGHDIELQAEDDGCNAEGGQTAGQKLVADPTIVGIVGTSCSGAGVPMSTVVSQAGYFMVSPSNTAPSLTDPTQAWNDGYLRTAHNDKVQGAAIADFAVNELGLTTAAAIHDGDPYTEGLANAFRVSFEELGGEIVEFTAVSGDVDSGALFQVARNCQSLHQRLQPLIAITRPQRWPFGHLWPATRRCDSPILGKEALQLPVQLDARKHLVAKVSERVSIERFLDGGRRILATEFAREIPFGVEVVWIHLAETLVIAEPNQAVGEGNVERRSFLRIQFPTVGEHFVDTLEA